MADDTMEYASPEDQAVFMHELLVRANEYAAHWEKVLNAGPSGAETAAFVLLAARVYVCAPDPISREEFLDLAGQIFDRAKEEHALGALVNADQAQELEDRLAAHAN